MEAIGFLELRSIAKGVECADIILKTAEVSMLYAKASCPGKYYILFHGEVASVRSSIKEGCRIGGQHVVDCVVIPNIHPQVIKAINQTSVTRDLESIGVMEFYSVTAAVEAADAAVKASDIDLVDVRLGTGIGGKSFIIITGEVAAVRNSVEAGTSCPAANGMSVDCVVIPNPHRDLLESLY